VPQPLLSILIPAVLERGFPPIVTNLRAQAQGTRDVEILVLYDNRMRSTGLKRQALLDAARGRYITCLDDDDDVAPEYLELVLEAIRLPGQDAEVIVFNSRCVLNGGNAFIVRTGIEFENEQIWQRGGQWGDIHRKPWHWCLWHRDLAKQASFPDGYIDDDWHWLRQMMPRVNRQHRIDRVLHFYTYDKASSLSNQGEPTT
jgi:glycosyltransferase involved in cell wall biosynthesis